MKSILAFVTTVALCACSFAKQVEVHDPVMAFHDGQYYLFSTGPGITWYQSDDLSHWRKLGRVFQGQPAFAKQVAPGFDDHIWAPDIIEKDGRFYLYYSVSAFGKNTSGIGVTVTDSLDPTSARFGWRDQGLVLQSIPGRDDWNAIDPAVIKDERGDYWLAFGSFWSGLKMVRLDATLRRIAQPEQWVDLAARPATRATADTAEQVHGHDTSDAGTGAIEAPFLFKKGDWYYLFVSFDKCCRGKDSTYKVMVGRSRSLQGPYLDDQGVDLRQGGGRLVIQGNSRWVALGHNAAYNFNGRDYLVLHAYETADNYLQKLRILPMTFVDGWPKVDPADLDRATTQLVE